MESMYFVRIFKRFNISATIMCNVTNSYTTVTAQDKVLIHL